MPARAGPCTPVRAALVRDQPMLYPTLAPTSPRHPHRDIDLASRRDPTRFAGCAADRRQRYTCYPPPPERPIVIGARELRRAAAAPRRKEHRRRGSERQPQARPARLHTRPPSPSVVARKRHSRTRSIPSNHPRAQRDRWLATVFARGMRGIRADRPSPLCPTPSERARRLDATENRSMPLRRRPCSDGRLPASVSRVDRNETLHGPRSTNITAGGLHYRALRTPGFISVTRGAHLSRTPCGHDPLCCSPVQPGSTRRAVAAAIGL
jgi:hypothetical protein